MGTYITLIDYTEQGARTIAESPDRADAFIEAARASGVTVKDVYWTFGGHDGVLILEAPDDKSVSTLLLSLDSLSENLYLLLSLLHLLALSRAERAEDPAKRQVQLRLASGWLALVLLTRSVGLALLLGFAVALFRRREPRRVPLLLAALVPVATWMAVKWALDFSGTYGSAYASKLASFSPERIDALGLAVWAQLGALSAGFSHMFALRPNILENAFALVAGLAAIVGGGMRLRRFTPDAVYVAVYLLMIAAWPFPAHAGRFLYVVLPVLFVWVFEGVVAAASWRVHSPLVMARVRVVALVALVVAPLPSLAFIAVRYADASGQVYASFTHTARWYNRRRLDDAVLDARFRLAVATAQDGTAELVPIEACVWATDPLELSLRAGRLAYGPPPAYVDGATFDAYVERCEYFFLSLRTLYPYEPFYPRNRLGTTLETLASFRGEGLPGNPIVAELVRVTRNE